MENCLVTKLKGVVDNNNLPKYNTITFKIHAKDKVITPYSANNLYFRGGTITCVNGNTFNMVNISTGEVLESNLTTKTVDSGTWANIGLAVAEEYVFEYSPKYEIQAIGFNGTLAELLEIDVSNFNFSPNFYEISIVSNNWNYFVNGIFNPLNKSQMTSARIVRTGATINISDYSISTLLRNFSATGKNIHGNIEDLSNCLQLGTLEVWGENDVLGEVTNLFSAMVSAGRTSGTLLIGAAGSSVTVNGVIFDQVMAEHGGTWAVVATFDPSAQGGYTMSYQ